MDTIQTNQKISYRERIRALNRAKLAFNKEKLLLGGYHDIDDHGNIPWAEPIPFKVKPNHSNGGAYGPKAIGENFRTWLEVHPAYINPNSALAGAWVGPIPGIGGWRPEDYPYHLKDIQDKYNLHRSGIGAMNHMGPDMTIGLKLGWGGILKKIRYYREFNRPKDTSFYDGEEALVMGVQTFIRRHISEAYNMAEKESNADLRQNLIDIAKMNEWLVENPPRTLREAVQFIAWFQSIDRMYHAGGALGQLDELLRPFYDADKAAGINDDEAVIWAIASLLFNDTHYSQIGGPAPDGHDLTSPMSYLILEAAHALMIPFNIALRVHDELDPKLLRKAIENTLRDGTGVSYSLSGGLDKGYMKNGFPIELARMRAKVGCNWTALPGIEYPIQDVTRHCLITPFLIAFYEMVDDPTVENSMDELWKRYTHHLKISCEVMKEGWDWHMTHHSQNAPEIVLNLFCHGPIERGMDAAQGGVDIYDMCIDGVGLATTADSLAAIEQRVVNEKRLTWEQLAEILRNDYADAEDIRLMLHNIPRFGSGNSLGDKWAKRISQTYVKFMTENTTPLGYKIIPGLFSHGDVIMLGNDLPATPNGRHAKAPISHSSEPDPGFMEDGTAAPTAKANAVAAVQPGRGNSAPLQLDIDKMLLYEEGGVESLETLIKTHNAMGGTLINLNVISKEKILEAHKDPSLYPDLVVRVTGYSAYFHSLSPQYRQQVVDRILAAE